MDAIMKKKTEDEASAGGPTAGSMSTTLLSTALPSIQGEEARMVDWDSEFLVVCKKCDSNIPFGEIDGHRRWHARVNSLISIRGILGGWGMPAFGPAEAGCLLLLDYNKGATSLLKPGVESEVLQLILMVAYLKNDPFVTLRYFEGLKYTFGTKFIGRESQGEFIWFDLLSHEEGVEDGKNKKKKKANDVEENYFQLECKDGGLWISSSTHQVEALCPSTIVAVNGVGLAKAHPLGDDNDDKEKDEGSYHSSSSSSPMERKLAFGDIITISVGHPEGGPGPIVSEGERRFRDFIFKPSHLRSSDLVRHHKPEVAIDGVPNTVAASSKDDDDDARQKSIQEMIPMPGLDNPLILQTLFRFLPTERVKELRSTSRLWGDEALPILAPQVRIALVKRGHNGFKSADSVLQISSYAHSRLGSQDYCFRFPHWRVEVPDEDDVIGDRMMTSRRAKIKEDLAWFLEKESKGVIETLLFTGGVDSEDGLGIFQSLLVAGTKSLQGLTLTLQLLGRPTSSTLPLLGDLKTLNLTLTARSTCKGISTQKNFLSKLILPSVSNIQALTLKDGSGKSFSPPSILLGTFFLEEVGRMQIAGDGFGNLTSITLIGRGAPQLKPLASLRKGSLRKLELVEMEPVPSHGDNHGAEYGGMGGLEAALGRHCVSLEELTLHFILKGAVPLNISFPKKMEALRALSLFVYMQKPWWDRPVAPLSFGGEKEKMMMGGTTVPSLTHLTVWPVTSPGWEGITRGGSWMGFQPVITSIVLGLTTIGGGRIKGRKQPLPIPNVTNLDVPLLLKERYHGVLDNLASRFPGVEGLAEEVREAKKSRLWKLEEAFDDEGPFSDEEGGSD